MAARVRRSYSRLDGGGTPRGLGGAPLSPLRLNLPPTAPPEPPQIPPLDLPGIGGGPERRRKKKVTPIDVSDAPWDPPGPPRETFRDPSGPSPLPVSPPQCRDFPPPHTPIVPPTPGLLTSLSTPAAPPGCAHESPGPSPSRLAQFAPILSVSP